MKYDPDRHHRRSIRLKGYDYARPGAYFITLCTRNRECSLGKVTGSEMMLSPAGKIVRDTLDTIQRQFPNIGLDAFVIMPNHIHGIITITGDGGTGDKSDSGRMGSGEGEGSSSSSSSSSKGLINQTLTSRLPTTSRPLPLTTSLPGSKSNADRLPSPDQVAADWIMMKNDALILGKIVRYLKARTSRMIHDQVSDAFRWQRNYYEHIIRNEEEMTRIRTYIINNPARWKTDDNYSV